jgi:hypothetical protein
LAFESFKRYLTTEDVPRIEQISATENDIVTGRGLSNYSKTPVGYFSEPCLHALLCPCGASRRRSAPTFGLLTSRRWSSRTSRRWSSRTSRRWSSSSRFKPACSHQFAHPVRGRTGFGRRLVPPGAAGGARGSRAAFGKSNPRAAGSRKRVGGAGTAWGFRVFKAHWKAAVELPDGRPTSCTSISLSYTKFGTPPIDDPRSLAALRRSRALRRSPPAVPRRRAVRTLKRFPPD